MREHFPFKPKSLRRRLLLGLALLGAHSSMVHAETFECLMEPMVVAKIGSPVQGVIEQLLVDRSELVKSGQPVAQLKSKVEQANFDQAKARSKMESEVRARTADLSLATHNMERMKSLRDRKVVSEQERDEAIAQLKVASAALQQARENYRLLQHELARAKEMLDQRTIRSPVDGVVVEQKAFPGEFVYENPVMTIAQLDPLRVEVILPAEMFGQFNAGDQAMIYPEIGGDKPLLAQVQVVDRLLDTRSGTFGLRLTLPNPDFGIPGGQKCRLEFKTNKEGIAAR
ncbi:MAG: efflux RND transporter periplasmic adaptor subunit [Pseudomonadales bacterium]